MEILLNRQLQIIFWTIKFNEITRYKEKFSFNPKFYFQIPGNFLQRLYQFFAHNYLRIRFRLLKQIPKISFFKRYFNHYYLHFQTFTA